MESYDYGSTVSTDVSSSTIICEDDISIEKVLKVLIVGNPKCGKSSIVRQYVSHSFDPIYKTTVGADFVRKDLVYIDANADAIGVRLQLWDIAGQDRFQKLTRAYFAGAHGVVIVCDVSRDGTVEAVRNWKHEINRWADENEVCDLPVVLFANKADLLVNPQASFKMGVVMERMCREEGILKWWPTSALSGESLSDGFLSLVSCVFEMERSNGSEGRGDEAHCGAQRSYAPPGIKGSHKDGTIRIAQRRSVHSAQCFDSSSDEEEEEHNVFDHC